MTEGVLFYQVTILVIILVAGRFGETALNRTALALAIFTLSHVFMPWLMVLQFVTIAIGHSIAKKYAASSIKKVEPVHNKQPETNNQARSDASEEESTGEYAHLCGYAASRIAESREEYASSSETDKSEANQSPQEHGRTIFDSFKEASAYAKKNPGTKITRGAGGRYVVGK